MITKEMTIDAILSTYPQKSQKIAQELSNAGLNCVGCCASTWETLESGVLGHGYPEEALERLLKRLNSILEEESDPETISLTPRAAKKYKGILEEEGKAGFGLRLGVVAAGCRGFEYELEYSEKPLQTDRAFTSEGVDIHVDEEHLDKLLGVVIDYVEGLNESGFKVSNPNAKGSCGCGKSQSY